MDIKLTQAIRHWFSQSSYDMVYLEAVANAMDAGALNINIRFAANSFSDYASYHLEIEDDGVGFTDERYDKFRSLMNVDDEDIVHRGLGRLVYLFYYKKVHVRSALPACIREFDFADNVTPCIDTSAENVSTGAQIILEGYKLDKIKDQRFVDPKWIKNKLLHKFISRLSAAKASGKPVKISIETCVGSKVSNETIDADSIPDFEHIDFVSDFTSDGNMTISYSVRECDLKDSSVVTALAIDARDEEWPLFSQPIPGYDMIFVLKSESFNGGIDGQRVNIILPKEVKKTLQKQYLKKIREILAGIMPEREEHLQKKLKYLVNMYPHLKGYFNVDAVAVSEDKNVIQSAQERFLHEQMELLKKTSLSTEDYEKSVAISGRMLTQYVLFRQFIIDKLKKTDAQDKEEVIHNLIVPKGEVLEANHAVDTLYKNNTWIFDDKFMTYKKVLSEQETTELLVSIDPSYSVKDANRPDIAIIFSADPEEAEKVDVVIIELKRKGLKAGENMKVEYQLEQRARALYPLYGDKIQTLWLYGVTQLDDEYKSTLSGMGYKPLFSKGTLFINTNPVNVDWKTNKEVPAVRYIMDIDAVVEDADFRNASFLQLIKGDN